ncbi:MAG: class I SAM-dependent methyltransferase [Planctomycetota bacterium]
MPTAPESKLTVEQIRQRFDGEVERFSNLETGQTAVMDAPLMLELVAQTVATLHSQGTSILDLGCGAGNYALKLLDSIPNANVTLVDLSSQMLAKALERVQPKTTGKVVALQGDLREVELGIEQFDVVTAGATLHHLRTDPEWQQVFQKVWKSLKPGGSFWIIDLVEQTTPELKALMWRRWGEYLTGLQGDGYREKVFNYVDAEDTPHALIFQLDLLRQVGFQHLEILHKTACFAAFGGIKAR